MVCSVPGKDRRNIKPATPVERDSFALAISADWFRPGRNFHVALKGVEHPELPGAIVGAQPLFARYFPAVFEGERISITKSGAAARLPSGEMVRHRWCATTACDDGVRPGLCIRAEAEPEIRFR